MCDFHSPELAHLVYHRACDWADWYAIPGDAVLLAFAGGGGGLGWWVASCGGGIVDSPTKVDIVRVAEHLFSLRCAPKRAMLHI